MLILTLVVYSIMPPFIGEEKSLEYTDAGPKSILYALVEGGNV